MAIGLMSFCLVAMLGMLPVGMSQERKSNDQMLALQVFTVVASDFKGAPAGSAKTSLYDIDFPSIGGTVQSGSLILDGNLKRVPEGSAKQFEVSYKIEPPSTAYASYRLLLRVYRTAQVNAAASGAADYVEGVVLKPAF